ncbi:helix-turn-helix domain-containing protein [Sporocytophaga myxococcoides]|uniref:Helix-turn-helix domain-containing protein n=2 Tax=Sporocytophaga myxococcoides TaxID=153721 RepID=A0A098LC28_9BACT|nr:helix-turn-helix domain-containing protein [Sporocytophaga myxococcoides]
MKDLGNILKSLRISKGISQDALAFEIEISLSTYSKLERGLTDITLSKLEKLAAFYEMDVVEVLLYGSSPTVIPSICKKLIEEKDREIMNLQKDLIEALKKNI